MNLVFNFLFSLGLGAPLGLFLILLNAFLTNQFSICCVFCGMSFLGWILELSFLFSVFSWFGGSPRPVSYTAKRFSD